jgi:carbon storage regulator
MLVLTRKRNESIVIDRDVEVTVLDIRGDKVRLGIQAPKHKQVNRNEIQKLIDGNNPTPPQST